MVMGTGIRTRFRLYLAGGAHNSVEALANLTALCREFLPDQHDIELVDVFQDPKRALAEGIFMTPTLVRIQPLPALQIVGTLSDTRIVLLSLGLANPSEIADDKRQHARYFAGGQPATVAE